MDDQLMSFLIIFYCIRFQELKTCFEKQDIPLLQETIAKLPPDIATYHMKRCVDSGLWLPEGGKKDPTESEGSTNSESVEKD